MTDNTQPEALRLALSIDLMDTFTNYQQEELDKAAAELRRQHARIAELEAQLEAIGAGGVNGPLIGRASLSANAVEPVAWWIPKAEQFCLADKSGDRPFAKAWEPLYAAPPTAQAEGWRPIETAPKDKSNIVLLRQPCGSIANGFWLAEAYAGNGAWIWPYVHKTPTHWMPLPPPPTSAEGVGHG